MKYERCETPEDVYYETISEGITEFPNEIIEDLNSIIEKAENNQRGNRPPRIAEMLKIIRDSGKKGPTVHDFTHLFPDSDEPIRNATGWLGTLNSRYLNPNGYHLGDRDLTKVPFRLIRLQE